MPRVPSAAKRYFTPIAAPLEDTKRRSGELEIPQKEVEHAISLCRAIDTGEVVAAITNMKGMSAK